MDQLQGHSRGLVRAPESRVRGPLTVLGRVQSYNCDLAVLNTQIKSMIKDLNDFKPIIDCLGTASDVGRMLIDFRMAIGGVILP